MNNGITYSNEDNASRGTMLRYHQASHLGLPFREHNKTAYQYDLTHLPNAERNLTTIVTDNGEIQSKFAVGFEIEKNSFYRGAVKEYPLFSHFEYDSSCGVEAVTNLLPLVGRGIWRNKVLNMFSEARRILDDRYSPSDRSCGGHITISCVGMTGQELIEALKPFSGILYSLYRYRLKNTYVHGNLFMSASDDYRDWVGHTTSSKYQVCKVMDDRIEFRLPSRVTSVEDMNLRYRLMYELVNFAVNRPNGTYASFIKRIKPILVHMYKGDTAKVDDIITLSKSFRKMLLTNKINSDVVKFVDRYQRLTSHYTTSLRRESLR